MAVKTACPHKGCRKEAVWSFGRWICPDGHVTSAIKQGRR